MLNIIVNPKSRSGYAKAVWKEIEEVLAEEKAEYKVFFTEYKDHAVKIAADLTKSNDKLKLVVLGGDGTINEVISGIKNYDNVMLGYIPTGSSNDLARSLKLPSKPKPAIMNILKPKYFAYLDIGETEYNGDKRKFLVSSGIGFDAAICHEALNSKIKDTLNKIGLGKLTYVGIALKQLTMFKPACAKVIIDDVREINLDGIYFISSHIHKYEGGGFMFCPQADYGDGLLDVCIVGALNKLKILLMFPSAYKGLHVRLKEIKTVRCKKIEIKTKAKLPVHADGESLGYQNSITVRCLDRKLKIVTGNI